MRAVSLWSPPTILMASDSESSDSELIGAMQAVSHEANIEAWSAQLSGHLASCPEKRMSFSALVKVRYWNCHPIRSPSELNEIRLVSLRITLAALKSIPRSPLVLMIFRSPLLRLYCLTPGLERRFARYWRSYYSELCLSVGQSWGS